MIFTNLFLWKQLNWQKSTFLVHRQVFCTGLLLDSFGDGGLLKVVHDLELVAIM